MEDDDFRRHAHRAADWMADYLETVEGRRVVPDVEPGEILAQLGEHPPECGEDFSQIFEDFRQIVMPGMTHWNHPGWFAYFPANHSPPSIVAEMLVTAIGAQCMSWQTSPAATELEQRVMEWLAEMIGLPGGFTGVIQDTASTATLVAMLGARERATGGDFGRMGAAAPGAGRLRVYTSTQAHSSVMKAARLAGFGTESVRAIEVDAAYAMEPGALRLAIEADVEAGERPACVVATVGTTSSTALDPLPQIAAICADHDIWLHVDAAYAGSAAILDERRWILDGIEGADSLVFNPHKWLMTNFDCSAYYVRDVEALLGTFATDPEYLRTARDSEVRNYRDWGVQLGRRFRALKLWFVIRSYGVDGLREILRAHIEWGERFARWVDEHEDFERLAPAPLGLVCFRCRPSSGSLDESELDALNLRLLEAINADGRVFLTHTRLDGRYTLRLAVGQRTTRLEDVELAWRLARREARRLLAQ